MFINKKKTLEDLNGKNIEQCFLNHKRLLISERKWTKKKANSIFDNRLLNVIWYFERVHAKRFSVLLSLLVGFLFHVEREKGFASERSRWKSRKLYENAKKNEENGKQKSSAMHMNHVIRKHNECSLTFRFSLDLHRLFCSRSCSIVAGLVRNSLSRSLCSSPVKREILSNPFDKQ